MACVFCSCCGTVMFYGSVRNWSDFTSLVHTRAREVPRFNGLPSLRFLYLVQTESCLPDHLDSVETIGNTSACQCDVLVLSYKQICSVTPPPHIEYLFNSSTTWTAGRNLLFEVARRRGKKHLYYIFMDDDIILKYFEKTVQKNPWREFEDFLIRIEPAVAAVDTDRNKCLKFVHNAREKQGCSLKRKTEYLTAVRFDAAFNAYHYQAVEYILPYSCRLDATSWWLSQIYAEIKCEIVFRGHTVLHTGLYAINTKRRPYPRGQPTGRNMLTMVEELNAKLPEEYQNSNILLQWKKDKMHHEEISSTYCLPPPPPHMPIKPYAHLRLNL